MRQFCAYRNRDAATRSAYPLLLNIQSDLISETGTRVVVPLVPATRKRNLRQAFSLELQAKVAGAHLALVDDVLTTGATAGVLAHLLRRAGALRVDVYCLARTPRPGDG